MTGIGSERIWRWRSSTLSRASPSPPTYPPRSLKRWSPPEQNALSPAPVSSAQPIVGSSRIRAKASIISFTVSGRKALWTSGRSIVTRAMPVPECS